MAALRAELRRKEKEIGELKRQLESSEAELRLAQSSLKDLGKTQTGLGECFLSSSSRQCMWGYIIKGRVTAPGPRIGRAGICNGKPAMENMVTLNIRGYCDYLCSPVVLKKKPQRAMFCADLTVHLTTHVRPVSEDKTVSLQAQCGQLEAQLLDTQRK